MNRGNPVKVRIRVLSIVLALALAFSLIPAVAGAEGAGPAESGAIRFICWDTAGFLCPGVTLGCYRDKALTDLVGSAASDASGVVEFAGLEAATYWFAVLAVPEGIAPSDAVIPLAAEAGKTVEFKLVVEKRGLAEFSYDSNQLKGIEAAGALSPAFHPDTKRYTLTLDEHTAGTTIKPLPADPSCRLYIAGRKAASKTVSLRPGGKATIKIQVKPARGRSAFYYVTVRRAKSTNADLSGLKVSRGTLQPAFGKETASYALTLAKSQRSVKIAPRLADRYAAWSMTVNGRRVKCGTVAVKAGETKTVVVRVRAQAGNTRSYTLTVTRAK